MNPLQVVYDYIDLLHLNSKHVLFIQHFTTHSHLRFKLTPQLINTFTIPIQFKCNASHFLEANGYLCKLQFWYLAKTIQDDNDLYLAETEEIIDPTLKSS